MQSKHRTLLECVFVECALAFLLMLVLCGFVGSAQTATDDKSVNQDDNSLASIPWGAMYTPNEHLTDKGMTGAVKYYRGRRGADSLIDDLKFAQMQGVRLILTLGSVTPGDYLDDEDHINMEIVHRELDPFLEMADSVKPFIEDGTIWGIRFMDEPHDPTGYPREFDVDPEELGEVFGLIRSYFGDVRVASTAPPWYLIQVPNAGYAFGQCNNDKVPPGFDGPVDFHRDQSELAHKHGLLYVASLNANTNPAENVDFFRIYRQMCELKTVDFVTSWQWPQGRYPMPSFESRFSDSDPAVQAEITEIPTACGR